MVLKENTKIKNTSIGQIFTPNYIAEFIVKNSLKYFNYANQTEVDFFNKNAIKVLEPSAGKGVFLKYLHKNNLNNITAYELDNNLRKSLLKSYPKVNFEFRNIFEMDLSENYDLIIGNPPYLGQNYNASIFQDYARKYTICKKYFVGNMDLFYYFIHLGISKLNPGGILSYITTNYWITKSKYTGIKLLKPHILDECFLLQYIDLSNLKLFKDALGQHNCIFVLQKKTSEEIKEKINKDIEIIQINKSKDEKQPNEDFNKQLFADLINGKTTYFTKKYKSGLTNNELSRDGSWNLLYPEEVKLFIKKFEKHCLRRGQLSLLKDIFIVRNGLILIKDEIFILNKKENLRIENDDYYVKINNGFYKLNEEEKKRIKKIYKSKSIKPYGRQKNDDLGYLIYLNKNEFNVKNLDERNQNYEKKYPTLTKYLNQYEKELKSTLINAKENPLDFYFPRRGSFIIQKGNSYSKKLVNLEPFYDKEEKIFFRYISDKNTFGYSKNSYYATSDTYFLWPKTLDIKIDYMLYLAYFNSKLVSFLFKAKNISIKRSKTKLEYGLPVPNFDLFSSKSELLMISLIKNLTAWMIEFNSSNDTIRLMKLSQQIESSRFFSNRENKSLVKVVIDNLKKLNPTSIQMVIDKLFFKLFNLKEKEIDYLTKKYYDF